MTFPFKAVIFDWAFTLVDLVDENPLPPFMKVCEFFEEKGFEFSDKNKAFKVSQEIFDTMRAISRTTHREATYQQVLEYILDYEIFDWKEKATIKEVLTVYYEEVFKPRIVFPDTPVCLNALQAMGIPMGIVSNTTNPGFIKRMECRKAGLASYFMFAIYSSEVPFRKPHSSIFHLALSYFDVAPAEVLFVGDNIKNDIEGAQKVGMKTAWINRNDEIACDGIEPNFILKSLEEVPELRSCSSVI